MQDLLKRHLEFLSPEYKQLLSSGFIERITQGFAESGKLSSDQIGTINENLLLFAVFMLSEAELVEAIGSDLAYSSDDAQILTTVLLQAFPSDFLISQSIIVDYFQSYDTIDQEVYSVADSFGLATARQKAVLLELVEGAVAGTQLLTKLPDKISKDLNLEHAIAIKITGELVDIISAAKEIQTGTSAPTKLAAEIAEAEAAMNSMQPIRTMARDIEVTRGVPTSEPTHTGASQADLLDRSATVKDKNPDARWGTEQT